MFNAVKKGNGAVHIWGLGLSGGVLYLILLIVLDTHVYLFPGSPKAINSMVFPKRPLFYLGSIINNSRKLLCFDAYRVLLVL